MGGGGTHNKYLEHPQTPHKTTESRTQSSSRKLWLYSCPAAILSVGGFRTGLGSTVILAAWADIEDSFSCRVRTRAGITDACGCANPQLGDSALSTHSVLRVMKDVREPEMIN